MMTAMVELVNRNHTQVDKEPKAKLSALGMRVMSAFNMYQNWKATDRRIAQWMQKKYYTGFDAIQVHNKQTATEFRRNLKRLGVTGLEVKNPEYKLGEPLKTATVFKCRFPSFLAKFMKHAGVVVTPVKLK